MLKRISSVRCCFHFSVFLVLQRSEAEYIYKTAPTGGVLQSVEKSSGSADDKEVETHASSSEVVTLDPRDENGGDKSPCGSGHLDADVDNLSECIGKEEGKKVSSLYHPVTREEMQQLKETENLFRSNLLKLQVLPPLTCSS